MKFGKLLRSTVDERMPQWRDHVLQYKRLKQSINNATKQKQLEACSSEQILSEFTNTLDIEVARVNDFYNDRIEEGVIILHALRGQAERFTATSGPDRMRHACQKSLVTFHFNLLILQNYVALNFTAIAKILKKFDKKLGLQLRTEYISAIVELPFYRCQALGSLVEDAESLFKAIETPASNNHFQKQQQQQELQQMQQAQAQRQHLAMPQPSQKSASQWQWQQQPPPQPQPQPQVAMS